MTDKISVETTGDFMLLDPLTGDQVEPEGFSEVTNSAFIQNKIAEGQLTAKPEPEPEAAPEKTPPAKVK